MFEPKVPVLKVRVERGRLHLATKDPFSQEFQFVSCLLL